MIDYSLDRLKKIKKKIEDIGKEIVILIESIEASDYQISVLEDRWDVADNKKEIGKIKRQYKNIKSQVLKKTKRLSSKYNQKYKLKYLQKEIETGNKDERKKEIAMLYNKIEKILIDNGFIYGDMDIDQAINAIDDVNNVIKKRRADYFSKTEKESRLLRKLEEDETLIERIVDKFINILNRVKEENRIKIGCKYILKLYGLISSKKKVCRKCEADFIDIEDDDNDGKEIKSNRRKK